MERLKKYYENSNFEVHKQIGKQTSETFIGNFKNRKSIFKLPKNQNHNLLLTSI